MTSRPQPLVLGIDTSGTRSGAALATSAGVVGEDYLPAGERRSEAVADLVARLLDAQGGRVAELAGLAVVVGPGSYTGLRSGLALARGLAFADAIPVVGIDGFELLALAAGAPDGPLVAALDAGRDRYYVAELERRSIRATTLRAPVVMDADELGERLATLAESRDAWVLCLESPDASEPSSSVASHASRADRCGSALAALAAAAGLAAVHAPCERAGVLATAAVDRLAAGEGLRAESVLPLYVGGTGARPNRNKVVVSTSPDGSPERSAEPGARVE